jgi:hypothetical protein
MCRGDKSWRPRGIIWTGTPLNTLLEYRRPTAAELLEH